MVQLGTHLICKMLVGGPSASSRAFQYSSPAFALELCPACGHLNNEPSPSASPCSSSSSSSSISDSLRQKSSALRQRPSALRALREILQREQGLFPKGLWRGLDISLVVTIPMVGIYMPLYDTLSSSLGGVNGGVLGPLAPAVAGMGARAVAVYATAPLELIRTQKQATLASPKPLLTPQPSAARSTSLSSLTSRLSVLSRTTNLASVSGMWLGVGATLWRDVPFTGIYWLVVEPMRSRLLDLECQLSRSSASFTSSSSSVQESRPSQQQVLWANLISGGISGALAAVVTTPFDVVKTRMQVSGLMINGPSAPTSSPPVVTTLQSPGPFSVFNKVWREEGLRGLFTGVGPRAARTAPACAIVIATYEVVKHALAPSQ
jgi:solute carrier family 25 protein 39/40